MPTMQPIVGPQNVGDGILLNAARAGRQGDQLISELHGRFYEQGFRGLLFSNGHTALTALTANTVTLTATTTPILGIYNPLGSGVNAVVLQAMLGAGINNTATTGPGAFVWASSVGNTALSTGSVPIMRLLGGSAAKCKGLTGVALTGLTNNLVVAHSADVPIPTVVTTSVVPTTVQTPTVVGFENVDGAWIVPPGGILALLNTVSTVTVSVHGRLLWEEVPA